MRNVDVEKGTKYTIEEKIMLPKDNTLYYIVGAAAVSALATWWITNHVWGNCTDFFHWFTYCSAVITR